MALAAPPGPLHIITENPGCVVNSKTEDLNRTIHHGAFYGSCALQITLQGKVIRFSMSRVANSTRRGGGGLGALARVGCRGPRRKPPPSRDGAHRQHLVRASTRRPTFVGRPLGPTVLLSILRGRRRTARPTRSTSAADVRG